MRLPGVIFLLGLFTVFNQLCLCVKNKLHTEAQRHGLIAGCGCCCTSVRYRIKGQLKQKVNTIPSARLITELTYLSTK
jgi:hypothetical protein